MDLNKVQLIGRLTRDPEHKTTPSGQSVVNFSLATSQTWEKDGQKQEKTEFSNIVAWGKLADIIAQYVKKGSKLYLEGKLETRDWIGQEDQIKRYRTEIIASNMIMLDGVKKEENGQHLSPVISKEETEAFDKEEKAKYIPF